MEGETSIPITTTTNNIINNRSHLEGMGVWKRWYRDGLLSRRRVTRLSVFIAFVIFSPVILPLFFLCCPFICIVAALLHLVPIRWQGDRSKGGTIVRSKGTTGGSAEVRAGLLNRYLDDQLGLVVDACFGSMD